MNEKMDEIEKILKDILFEFSLLQANDDRTLNETAQKILTWHKKEVEKKEIENAVLYTELQETDSVICALCKRLNPQHSECVYCDDRKERLKLLSTTKGLIK